MAKARGRKTTTLDSVAIAAGSALGRLAARIDSLTKQREAITTEIQRYARQAEGALKGLAAGKNPFAGPAPRAAKAAPRKRRTMSLAARRKIAAAQKARWARARRKAARKGSPAK